MTQAMQAMAPNHYKSPEFRERLNKAITQKPLDQWPEANLKAVMQIFPKVTEAYCFTKLMVRKARLDGRQAGGEGLSFGLWRGGA